MARIFAAKGVYTEIVKMEKLVMTDSFADKQCNVISTTDYGFSEDFPTELKIHVIFKGENGKTRLVLKHSDISKLKEE